MMLRTALVPLLTCKLFAFDLNDVTFESILHYEHEYLKGHDIVTPLLNHCFKDDEQNLATFFNILSYSYLSQDDTYGFNLEGRANLKISKSEYSAPIYLNKYSLDDINNAMLSMASIDFHSSYLSLSLGRNRVALDWLHGSIDSVILFHEDNFLSARAFWFLNYYDMQVNYTKSVESLNDDKGMYGLYLQSGEYFEQFELSLYYYLLQDTREMFGTQGKFYMSPTLSINGSYTYSKDLLRSMDESYFRVWGEYLFHDAHEFSLGMSQTGENPLQAMLQLGSHPFSEFYLGNEIARSKAENYYMKYLYMHDDFYVDSIYGQTHYYDDVIDSVRLKKEWMDSQEFDITLGVFLNDYLSFDLSYMLKDVDERDFLQFDQQLIMLNLTGVWL